MQYALGCVRVDKEEQPLLGEHTVRHIPENDEIERQTYDGKHCQIAHYPLHIDIIQGGEVILTPLAVFTDMPAKR